MLAYSLESLLPNGEQAEQLRAGSYRNFPVLLKYVLRASLASLLAQFQFLVSWVGFLTFELHVISCVRLFETLVGMNMYRLLPVDTSALCCALLRSGCPRAGQR
jgi:hypothetical protein